MPDAGIFQKCESGVGMKSILHTWQLLLLVLAGWINRQQQNAIEYLIAENRILREKIGKKRILLNDDQRRRLAVKGKILGRKALAEICSIVTPETILRWHRNLVAIFLVSGAWQSYIWREMPRKGIRSSSSHLN